MNVHREIGFLWQYERSFWEVLKSSDEMTIKQYEHSYYLLQTSSATFLCRFERSFCQRCLCFERSYFLFISSARRDPVSDIFLWFKSCLPCRSTHLLLKDLHCLCSGKVLLKMLKVLYLLAIMFSNIVFAWEPVLAIRKGLIRKVFNRQVEKPAEPRQEAFLRAYAAFFDLLEFFFA